MGGIAGLAFSVSCASIVFLSSWYSSLRWSFFIDSLSWSVLASFAAVRACWNSVSGNHQTGRNSDLQVCFKQPLVRDKLLDALIKRCLDVADNRVVVARHPHRRILFTDGVSVLYV